MYIHLCVCVCVHIYECVFKKYDEKKMKTSLLTITLKLYNMFAYTVSSDNTEFSFLT